MTLEEAENLKPGTIIHGDFDDGQKYTIERSHIDGYMLHWNDVHSWHFASVDIFSLPEPTVNNIYEIF